MNHFLKYNILFRYKKRDSQIIQKIAHLLYALLPVFAASVAVKSYAEANACVFHKLLLLPAVQKGLNVRCSCSREQNR